MHTAIPDDIPEPALEAGAVEVTYETLGDLVPRFHDHTEEIPVRRVHAIEGVHRDQGHKIVATGQQSNVLSERISETMTNTRSGATMTREAVNELIERRVAEALEVRDTARNLKPLVEGEGGNGNEHGNGHGGGNGHNFGGLMPVARECTYQDFLKCQPLNFTRTEGVVGLTRWFEKMETVFHISNCPQKYQVKYATCTLLNNALTWWNSHKRAIGFEAAYAMKWTELIKMVPNEEDKVERFIGCSPDNIQGNMIIAETTRLQDAIRVANNLMDQKLKGYARNAENKRRFDNNPRDNHGQQPTFKRQNIGGQNVARAYTARSNERKGYVGSLPYCNKFRLHHEGPCTVRCGNCKRVGHTTRDCTAAVAPVTPPKFTTTQRNTTWGATS
ncbi:putative reverse transcriptase domain-containing protein [Tanacetum coccineum]